MTAMTATALQESGPTWYDATSAPVAERPRLNFDLDVEVCVVGAGLAGLTVAREAARRGWSVAVLEARRIAWNASGRNCGFVRPGFACGIDRIVERVGIDHAKELWKLSEQGVAYVRDTVTETGMPGVAPVAGWLDVSKADDGDEFLRMLALLGQEFGAEVEGWPVERVRDVLKTSHYFHALHFPGAFHIHALNYAHGLAAAAEQAGARIFEETPAIEIDPAGVRKRVMTPAARVRASHVVLAGNVHVGGLVPHLAETVLPVASYVAVTAPLGDQLADAITWRGGVSDGRYDNYQYRIVDGDRLMWAGAPSVQPRSVVKPAQQFKDAIRRIYPQLGEVELAHAWAGVYGLAVHRMPQIGEVSPGVWLASAFGGHGLNTSAMAGELIARAIVDGDDRWRLFVPYELVWAGGAIGRELTRLTYWIQQARETVTAGAARRREALRRDEEARDGGEEARGDGPTASRRPASDPVPASVVDASESVPARPEGQASGRGGGRRRKRARRVDKHAAAVVPASADEAGGEP